MKRMTHIASAAALLFLLMASMFTVLIPQPVEAASNRGCDGWYGRGCWRGFFTNVPDPNYTGSNVIENGIYVGDNDKVGFINRVKQALNSGSLQDRTGAQFIILIMLGNGAGVDRNVDSAELAEWEERILSPRVYMRVSMQNFDCNVANTYFDPDAPGGDIAAGYSTPGGGCGVPDLMIDFFVDGVFYTRIRAACANPLGKPQGLPDLPPPPQDYNLSPSSSVNPTTAEAGQTVRFTHYVAYSGSVQATTFISVWDLEYPSGSSGPAPGAQGCAALGGTKCQMRWSSTQTFGPSREVAAFDVTISPSAPVGSLVCQTLTIERAQANSGGTLTATNRNSAPACVRVSKSPLVYFDKGDVRTGGAFSLVDAACTVGNNKIITSLGGGKGSNVQYGAYASGVISGFGSMGLPADNMDSRRLLFANTPTLGSYRSSNPCLNDFSTVASSTAPQTAGGPININSLPDGIHKFTGNITIAGSNNIRKKVTIVATGSVTITGNGIEYANGSYGSVSEIPRVVIVANNGNIIVNSSVRVLDGIYVAKGSGNAPGNGGVFRTCEVMPVNKDSCPNQLVVNGSIIANAVSLRRTGGNKNSPVRNLQPAEYLILREDAILGSYGASLGSAEARTVIETELPPRY